MPENRVLLLKVYRLIYRVLNLRNKYLTVVMGTIKKLYITIGLLILVALNYVVAQSQQQVNVPKDTTDIWIQANEFIRRIPSIETFIDSAISKNPQIKINGLNVKRKELEITKAKRNWTKDIISGSSDINYGRFDNLIIAKDLGIDNLNTTTSSQTRYSVGLSLKIPITPFLDKTDIKIAKVDLEQVKAEKQEAINVIRNEVYAKYNILIDCYIRYKILSGDFDTYNIISQQAEKDFYQNQNTITGLLNVKMSTSKAKIELLQARNNLEKAIWDIHELTGIQIQF
jgi:outer membrane protein TolC